MNKAEKLSLHDIEIDKNNGVYTVAKRKCYGGKVLFTSKSGISVSRQLTKMYWDKYNALLQEKVWN